MKKGRKRERKRTAGFAAAFAALLAVLLTTPLTAQAAGTVVGAFEVTGGEKDVDYSYDETNEILTIRSATPLTIKNTDPKTATEALIKVADGISADITLAGVNIRSEDGAAFSIADNSVGDVTLRIEENTENYLDGWHGSEGIRKAYDPKVITPEEVGTLTITGAGFLQVDGGSGGDDVGIGSGTDESTANIVIEVTGSLKIYGCDAPGIGSKGKDGTARNVVIRGEARYR